MKISEILHQAADKYLASTTKQYKSDDNKNKYSCCAIKQACTDNDNRSNYYTIMIGLKQMGCDISRSDLFSQYGDNHLVGVNKDVQGMRYFWLKWAALMAEEQGQ